MKVILLILSCLLICSCEPDDDNNYEALLNELEAFHMEHWSRDNYFDYLTKVWGVPDDSLINDLVYKLPDVNTEEYFKMTIKYDQFAWGWEDAELNGHYLIESGWTPPSILDSIPIFVPISNYRYHCSQKAKELGW